MVYTKLPDLGMLLCHTFLEQSGSRRGAIDKTLFIKQDKKDIMLVQVYVDDIIFVSIKKSWCDEFEELMKNRFQMSSMGELTFFLGLQVTPKTSHLQAVKRIIRRLISWQCKKQTIMVISTTEAEYVVVTHCCGQVLWIQNQLLDYGFNIMNIKIYIDNESIICIVKNPVFHSKIKHIQIQHHFIRDAYEKKLIQVLKIHTDDNVADLLTKAFDVSSKELASPKQTALGNDKLNMFMAGSFPKTIWVFNSPMIHLLRVEMVINSPWMLSKNWLVQKQTALGKDTSNPLIVDSLLKTIWFSIHHHLTIEVLAIPGQTATGVNTFRCDEDRLELMELTVFLLPKVKKVGVEFWTTVAVKKVNDVTRLQALVDKKKVAVTKAKIRDALCLDDAEGIKCISNEEIFAELARMGYEKPSTKLTFYKAF
nr:putative ribonuclease H-like domain-containing protein [Tanacetum cinerariifolium]